MLMQVLKISPTYATELTRVAAPEQKETYLVCSFNFCLDGDALALASAELIGC